MDHDLETAHPTGTDSDLGELDRSGPAWRLRFVRQLAAFAGAGLAGADRAGRSRGLVSHDDRGRPGCRRDADVPLPQRRGRRRLPDG